MALDGLSFKSGNDQSGLVSLLMLALAGDGGRTGDFDLLGRVWASNGKGEAKIELARIYSILRITHW